MFNPVRMVGPCIAGPVVLLASCGAVVAQTQRCIVQDVGGTAALPPVGCDYISPVDYHLMMLVPPGTALLVDATHEFFTNTSEVPGGMLGGTVDTFDSTLTLDMTGTGMLSGFARTITVPGVMTEVHTAPRTPGTPVQTFDTEMVMLSGGITGDPDFDMLTFRVGSAFGLPPSPGRTTLVDLGGGFFNVHSFFDVSFEIDFVGSPGGALGGLSGISPGVVRMQTGTISNRDDCFDSDVDEVGPGQYPFDTTLATTGPEGQTEPACYAFGTSGIDNDVWLTYLATSDGTAVVDTCLASGSNPDTKLQAWDVAPCPGPATSLACNDDTCGLYSEISFPITAGTSYVLQLGSFPTAAGGTGELRITETPSTIGFDPGPPCDPVPNTTGLPSQLFIEGSTSLSAMDVRLFIDNVPTGRVGIFLVSRTLGFIAHPGGSTGNVCVTVNIGRYRAPGQIFAGAGVGDPMPPGGMQVASIPVPINPPIAAFTAETWYFQAWNRDAGNTTNFSNAICVTFVP